MELQAIYASDEDACPSEESVASFYGQRRGKRMTEEQKEKRGAFLSSVILFIIVITVLNN